MWTNYQAFNPGSAYFNSPATQLFDNPFTRNSNFASPLGNDMFSMGGNSSIAMAQMLPMMMAAIIQQQLALMFLAELLTMGGGQRNNGQGGGQSNGRFPNNRWGGHRRMPPGSWNRGGTAGGTSGPAPGRTGAGTTGAFLQQAMSQNGNRYVYGAEASANNANPNALDCSELVEWAAARSGGYMPDGSANQLAYVRQHGTQMSVEQALRTPGALLFRPGHVAISLGDGRTIEARGRNYGVGVFSGSGRFTSAGMIPGMQQA